MDLQQHFCICACFQIVLILFQLVQTGCHGNPVTNVTGTNFYPSKEKSIAEIREVINNASALSNSTLDVIKDELEHEEEDGVEKLEDIEKGNKKVKVVQNNWDQLGWLQLPRGYNKEFIPLSFNENKPLKVALFINIRNINTIDMYNEKITLDLDFYEFWADPRFHMALDTRSRDQDYRPGYDSGQEYVPDHQGYGSSRSGPGYGQGPTRTKREDEDVQEKVLVVQVHKLHPDFVSKMWVPDLLIENTVLVPHNDLTREPLVSFNSETGFVKYSRLELTSSCIMSFFFYPLDTQTCGISIRSYKHFSEYFDLSWVHTGVFLAPVNNPNYGIRVNSVTQEKRIAKTINFPNLLDKDHVSNIIWTNTSFDVLNLELKFRRNVSFHLAQTYIPSACFIAITWLCFLLPPSLGASRLAITMATLLTSNTMFISVRQNSPQVSYAKAIDVWMMACTLFTFLSLLVFIIMAWLEYVKDREERRSKEFGDKKKKAAAQMEESGGGDLECQFGINGRLTLVRKFPLEDNSRHGVKMLEPRDFKIFLRIRKFVRNHGLTFLFVSFFLFNLCYWTSICAGSGYFDWEVDPRHNG